MKRTLLAVVLLSVLVLAAVPARAHRVNVFAVLENGVVTGEGYFGGGTKAQDCRVDILDSAGKVLASGRTGSDGMFNLALPAGAAPPLTVVLSAGEGHRSEYTLAVQDPASAGVVASPSQTGAPGMQPGKLTGGASAEPSRDAASMPPGKPGGASTQAAGGPGVVSPPPAAGITAAPGQDGAVLATAQADVRLAALVQAAAGRAVEEKLAPLRLELARIADAEQSTRVRDIVGGLGWIVGLIGLAAWFKRPGK